ncbi:MAG: hypothetical protein LBC96_04995 [Lachnospiraceae bacterium]|nr:hypothetical protein [Lachnospiraceae bacterium]
MQEIIKKSIAIKRSIIIIGICLIVTVFPFSIWKETTTTTVSRLSNDVAGPVTNEDMVLQSFIAQHEHLQKITVFITSGSDGEAFIFRMLAPEPGYRQMFEDTVMIKADNLPGYYDILIDQTLEVGETYYYIFQGTEATIANDAETSGSWLFLGAEWILRAEHPDAGQLYYQDMPMSGQSLAVTYHYSTKPGVIRQLICIAIILLVTALLLYVIKAYYRRYSERDQLIIAEQAMKAVLNPLVILIVIAGIVAVLLQTFGSFPVDNAFFIFTILIGGAISFYAINHCRDGQSPIVTKAILRANWQDYIQSLLFAAAFIACCEYFCAQLNIHHSIAQNKQLIYFGLVIMSMMSWRRIFSFVNLVYIILAAGFAYNWHTQEILQRGSQLSSQEMTELTLLTISYLVGGLVILNVLISVIISLRKKEMKPLSVGLGSLILLFLILMVVFGNGREWVLLMAGGFTLFYLQYGASKRRDVVLNAGRGLILSFFWVMVFSLLYRPFATFTTVSYPMIFHTPTVTSVYLALVATVALLILLVKLRSSYERRTNTDSTKSYTLRIAMRDLWKEILLLGTVLTYMIFAISWTGYLTFTVVAVLGLCFFTVGKGKGKLKSILFATGLIIISVLACFPPLFFLQRNIPAIVGNPYVYTMFDMEEFHQDITRGRNPESLEYILLGNFMGAFGHKVFDIPNNTFNFYGFGAGYEEAHVVLGGEVIWIGDIAEEDLEYTMTLEEKRQELMEMDVEVWLLEYWGRDLGLIPYQEEIDISNGRFELFEAYMNGLNLFGHETMGFRLDDGTMAIHAHNIYLQFAHDHGIFMGILFIIVGGVVLIYSIKHFRRSRSEASFSGLPFLIIIAVATMGMVEWVFHFSHPAGFIMMIMIAPLIFPRYGTINAEDVSQTPTPPETGMKL